MEIKLGHMKEVLKEVVVNYSSFNISRIPDKAKERFVALAKEEFANDYGMALLWLLDFRDGILSSPNEVIMQRLDMLANEINALNQRVSGLEKQPEEKKQIRTIGGRILTV